MPVTIESIYTQKHEIEQNKFFPKEAHNRLLISRGYYASFLYACELFKSNAKFKLTLYCKCNADDTMPICFFISQILTPEPLFLQKISMSLL